MFRSKKAGSKKADSKKEKTERVDSAGATPTWVKTGTLLVDDKKDHPKTLPATPRSASLRASSELDPVALHDIPEGAGNIDDSSNAACAPRPPDAVGTFLRIVTMNDVYKLENYPSFKTAVSEARGHAKQIDCVVTSHLNGDFLAPCILSALDGGRAMATALDLAGVQYACIGNHELDLGFAALGARVNELRSAKVVNSNVPHESLDSLQKFATIKIGNRWCVLGGFLTEDPSIYAPSLHPPINPVNESIAATWEVGTASLRQSGDLKSDEYPSLFLPMTHQLMKDDQETARVVSSHPTLASRTPVILAGHDHEPFEEVVEGSLIVKVGADAETIGFVDIYWDASGDLKRKCTLVPASTFALDPTVQKFREEQEAFLDGMMCVPIARLPVAPKLPLSTKRVRFEASEVASFLLSLVKRGLGVEVAMIQGGAVRASKDYRNGHAFTIGDLFNEFAFDCDQAVIQLPGHIISESVLNSRASPKPAPNFIHLDNDCVVETRSGTPGAEEQVLLTLNGAPLEPERMYTVAIYQFLLSGLNVIEPLMTYVKESGMQVPDVEACRPVKDIVLELCMKDAWRRLLGLEHWASDSHPSSEEVKNGIDRGLVDIGASGNGFVSSDNISAFFDNHASRCPTPARRTNAPNTGVVQPDIRVDDITDKLVKQMIKTLDVNGDGKVTREELLKLAT